MTWQEVLEEVHSVEFDVNLNVVSSSNAFFHALSGNSVVLEAYHLMRRSGDLCEEVLDRLSSLVAEDTDPHFENPNDTPLTVLLWLTVFAAPDSAEIAASWVDEVPRCWYAKKLARRILNPPRSTTANYQLWGNVASPAHNLSSETRFMMTASGGATSYSYNVKIRLGSSARVSSWTAGSGFVPITVEEPR